MKDHVINEAMIEAAVKQVQGLLVDYHGEIMDAFDKLGEDEIKINLPVTFTMTSKGLNIKTDIAFVKDRVKESINAVYQPNQKPLFREDNVDRVDFRFGDKVVSLGRKGGEE